MAEKIKLKGQLKLPVVGRNPIFAQMKFVKVALSEPDILPDSGSIFTCDEQGNYDFEIYTGKHLLSYNVGNAWSKPIEIIAEPLAEGLESIEISDLIGFQEIPELDATIAALNQQKQELLVIQQDITDKQAAVATAAANIDSTVADVEAGYPSLLAAQLSKSVTVNAATGDDATADGSSEKPYKTIKTAIESQPDLIKINVMLEGGNDKSSAHLISSMILYKSRSVTLTFNNNHAVLSDEVTTVFAGEVGGRFVISDAGGGANIHVNTSKTLFSAGSEAQVHIGGTNGVNFYVSDSASIAFLVTGAGSVRGVSKLTTSNLSMLNASGSAPATASVTAVSTTGGAAVIVNHSRASMGSNYSDGATSQTVTLINSTKLVSM